ncbi:MAG: zinc ribbon domain-containing protein [Candidatus Pacebacteria bacterium]|nr:zinc ribbon domain-containing protein [Candidatus Paceibacterota bacterium]MBP9840235.1 zinc ribbon domain-containing protein [Candidatus Paceibacterota bacterium]
MGSFRYRGEIHPGKHEAMITAEEFDKVQMLLGREGRPRPKTHEFPFTGIISCGECGSSITAINKTKVIKRTGEVKTFTYYYCTRRRKGSETCSQRTYLSSVDLESQIGEVLETIEIPIKFKEWALEVINEQNDSEIFERTKIHETQQRALLSTQNQLDTLTKMRYRELIGDEEFLKERKTLQMQLQTLKDEVKKTENRAAIWIELTENAFKFACHARQTFSTGDLQTKKEILLALGQNYTLKDQKIAITLNEWLKPLAEKHEAIEAEVDSVRTKKNGVGKGQKEPFSSLSPFLRERRDLNPQPPP